MTKGIGAWMEYIDEMKQNRETKYKSVAATAAAAGNNDSVVAATAAPTN